MPVQRKRQRVGSYDLNFVYPVRATHEQLCSICFRRLHPGDRCAQSEIGVVLCRDCFEKTR